MEDDTSVAIFQIRLGGRSELFTLADCWPARYMICIGLLCGSAGEIEASNCSKSFIGCLVSDMRFQNDFEVIGYPVCSVDVRY